MRICYLAVARIPSRSAQSIQVMRMAQALAETGHDVTLILPRATTGEDVYQYYGARPIFDIQRIPRLKLREVGMVLWGCHAAMASRRYKPDLIYGRQVYGCFFAALLGFPVVLEIHEPPCTTLSKTVFSRLTSMPSFTRLVTNSAGLAQILKTDFNVPSDKILAAPNGAEDPGDDFPLKSYNRARIQVGYVGQLYPGRGIDHILEMARACRWADFHVVGGLEEDIHYWMSRSKELNNVIFHGFVPPAEAEQYRQHCDILLAPYPKATLTKSKRNQSDYMSPLKLFEYMASGRAILCADHEVLREIVRDEQTALLCNPENSEEWVRALHRLRDHPNLRHDLGRNARAAFLHEFTRIARANKVLEGIGVARGVESKNWLTPN